MSKSEIDEANASFWNELCGTGFAMSLGINDHSLESLQRFDQAYMDLYPYLTKRVPVAEMRGKRVLDIGLGYGTLGQKIADEGAIYTGLDIAKGPVDMLNHRLKLQGLPGKAIQGSMLNCPLEDSSVDCVVSIGCFHHTGNIARCIDETWRVLVPGGCAYIMVYNRFSYRQWIKWPMLTLRAALAGRDRVAATEAQRKAYDASMESGKAAPETVFVSQSELRVMMSRFSRVSMELENSDSLAFFGKVLVSRNSLLGNLGKFAGLDIYATAIK